MAGETIRFGYGEYLVMDAEGEKTFQRMVEEGLKGPVWEVYGCGQPAGVCETRGARLVVEFAHQLSIEEAKSAMLCGLPERLVPVLEFGAEDSSAPSWVSAHVAQVFNVSVGREEAVMGQPFSYGGGPRLELHGGTDAQGYGG
jgi:hypothetical protein